MRIGRNEPGEVEEYTDFIKDAEGLKSTLRTAWTAEGRQESTAEHSWRLALFAGVMCREFPELDREKVLMMCLVHDLGERYSGDISAALRPDADDKLNREREDMVKCPREHAHSIFPEALLNMCVQISPGYLLHLFFQLI